MATLRVQVEVGPKQKGFAAVATDWPGLERGGRTREEAVTTLLVYVPRYRRIATLARLGGQFVAPDKATIVEEYTGTGSTDFWRISFAFSSRDRAPMSREELTRELAILRACWAYFDSVRERVSAEMRKGPRGGGRDRERIVQHVLGVEQDWAKKVGLPGPDPRVLSDAARRTAYRREYLGAIRAAHAAGGMARNWPLRYLIRHSAYHTMDHAWEMEDKDLTDSSS